MKRSTYYYAEARRMALKGFALLAFSLACGTWLVAILPLASGIPLAIVALFAAAVPVVTVWSEAGRLYKKADSSWLREKGFKP